MCVNDTLQNVFACLETEMCLIHILWNNLELLVLFTLYENTVNEKQTH